MSFFLERACKICRSFCCVFGRGVVLPFGERAFVLGGKHFADRFMSPILFTDICTACFLEVLQAAYYFCFICFYFFLLQSSNLGTGKMDQQLKALTALPEDPGSILSTHMAA